MGVLDTGFCEGSHKKSCLLTECAVQKYADSEVQKVPSQYFVIMHFLLPSIIIIAITSNEP